jgi:glycosyltransferase involved in cell wall biosynthesis
MTEPSGISAVIITCEDEDVLEPCLVSVADWVDEIIVVDMHSTDGTRSIAARYGARLVDHDRLPYAEPVRNFAMEQAIHPWLLVLDPDERVLWPLAQRLREVAREDAWDVVDLPFIQAAFGRALSAPGTQDGAHPRFIRRGVATWPAEIHMMPTFHGLRRLDLSADGDWRKLDLAVLHDTWRSPHQVLEKLARYVPKDAERRLARGDTFTFQGMVQAVIGEFHDRFVRGRAYEDGMAGFLHATLFAVMEFGVHAEMWQQQGRPPGQDLAVMKWGHRTVPLQHLTRVLARRRGVARRLKRVLAHTRNS